MGGGEAFLLLPHVLLEGEASVDGRGVVNLDLLGMERTLKRVWVEEAGEPSKTICLWEGGHS